MPGGRPREDHFDGVQFHAKCGETGPYRLQVMGRKADAVTFKWVKVCIKCDRARPRKKAS